MEIFRRFAMNENGIFGFESIKKEDVNKYKDVFLPFPMHETQLCEFLSIWLYAERIAENFGEIVNDNKPKYSTTICKVFRNDKIIISSEREKDFGRFDGSTYYNEIKISNGKGELQIHADRTISEHNDTIGINLDKTNGKCSELWHKLHRLDVVLSDKAGIPSLYELTEVDTSEFPVDFF